ncbi:hypothetical protein M2175_001509 [Bradyrhizobium elkanii]|uniref:Uncharacterized protein n=1 Tax=Bradyrhizobium japonicum TaxID=375 RepID=A0A1L3F4K9_BRAJP|nr:MULTISPECIES: hypothetical protein [Bradyrhizobium]APG08238.1 hypothetical protein BKD09_07855 [Bradyrhizobium japonicum]MCS3926478.1 hypothetical protein [Bradyrhizobium elkanii]MCS3967029.1 hypothetical protein [Bradyrhizobium japonicum]
MTFTTWSRSRIWAGFVCALVLAGAFNAAGASAATPAKVSGSTALALAGVIAPLSPDLTGAERKAVAMLFAANAEIPYKKPIVVMVDRIVCRTGNVDITLRSCELTFGKKSRTVNGSTANEIFATEALAGIPPDGAAGSNFESLSKLSCTIDPNAIRRKDGSGADCTFLPGN